MYQICSQAILHAVKHGQSKSIHIDLKATLSQVDLKICDDSQCYDYHTRLHHLKALQVFAEQEGGTLSVCSSPLGYMLKGEWTSEVAHV